MWARWGSGLQGRAFGVGRKRPDPEGPTPKARPRRRLPHPHADTLAPSTTFLGAGAAFRTGSRDPARRRSRPTHDGLLPLHVAIMPLAGYIGHATEQLAERLGGGIGGLMNATFGNATELIIGAFALHEACTRSSRPRSPARFSATSCWSSAFGAGRRIGRESQRFNRTRRHRTDDAACCSAMVSIVPGFFHHLSQNLPESPDLQLDTEIAVVLFITYCLGLVFAFEAHRRPRNRRGRGCRR